MTGGARSGLDAARELRRRGVVENNAGRPLAAQRLFRRALNLVDRTPEGSEQDRRLLRSRVQISQAFSEYELNGLQRGLAALSEITDYAIVRADPAVAVHLHLQEGFMWVRGGEFAEALTHLDRAVGLLDHADAAAACNILVNRGMVRLYLGDLPRARIDFQRAAERAQANQLPVEELKARHNLGCVEFYAGNLALALREMDLAQRLSGDVSQAVFHLDRAKVLIEAGLHREADAALLEAHGFFRSQRLWHDVGEVELARAECALLSGEVQSARQLAGTARDRFRRRGNQAWRRSAELLLLQADLAAGRPGARLAPPARRLVAEFRANGLVTQARTAQLIAAEALLRSGRSDEAAQLAAELPTAQGDPISVRLYDHFVHARLAVTAADTGAARRHVRNGLIELAQYQSSFGSIDLQSASAVHGRRLAELDLEMALADGRATALLDAVERGRSTSNRLRPVQSPADEDTARLLAELRRTVESIRAGESGTGGGPLGADRDRVAELQRALRSRSWHAAGSRRSTRSAKSGEVVAALEARSTSLVCCVQVGGFLHVLHGDRNGLQIAPIGPVEEIAELALRVRADLDVIANGRMPAELIRSVHGSLRRSLGELDDRLIGSLGLTDERVLVVPTGRLATLPWGSLPSLRTRPVVVAPSASTWLSASTGPSAPVPATSGPAEAPTVAVFAGPGLARSEEEAKAVGEAWAGSVVRTGPQAGPAELIDAMGHASVVHVAAHGEHQAENPLFSSIRLTDGPVFAYEFDQTARGAEHVVLSACELGQATIRPGDEALGLTSVLLHLGTRSVVAGVARVHDDVAADVMIRYHVALAAGVDSARALADACAAETDRPAPFTCFGATWSRSTAGPTG